MKTEYAIFVSPSQINCQVPFNLDGVQSVRVSSSNGSDDAKVSVAPVAPAILAVTYGSQIVSSTNPAPRGGTVVAYMTGLGRVAGTLTAGQPSTSPENTVLTTVDISVGQNHVAAQFAGLTPGFAGLYQVNFIVPVGSSLGTNPLQIGTTGVYSRNYSLFVGPASS